jgi:Gram-negative bacterial TonB protein C-terminal
MHQSLITLAMSLTLAGCASQTPPGYFSTYRVSGSEEMQAATAERAVAEVVASGRYKYGGQAFDQPIKLLRAPQPTMSSDDTDQRVTGQVVADIYFAEAGDVERVTIFRSAKDSLAEAVSVALAKWQIAPLTRGGTPTKVTVRQSFSFKTEW